MKIKYPYDKEFMEYLKHGVVPVSMPNTKIRIIDNPYQYPIDIERKYMRKMKQTIAILQKEIEYGFSEIRNKYEDSSKKYDEYIAYISDIPNNNDIPDINTSIRRHIDSWL